MRRFDRPFLLLLMLWLAAGLTFAQDATATPDVLTYGQVVPGSLDNRTPRQVYVFDGQRGEYVDIRLTRTGGNLDAVLTVLDSSGTALVSRDDTGGNADPDIHMLRIPRTGRYTIVVGRFGYALGSTSGSYELLIERVGVSFESGSALRYGDTVVNAISNNQPNVYYSFRAARGDVITLLMRRDSGDLDPFLQVVDANRRIIAENDDMPGSKDSQIDNLVIENEGNYLIIASRYDGTGDFFLSLQRADRSGVGISPQVAIPLEPGRPVDNEITNERFQVYYSFQARRDDIITLRMSRINGNIDSYLSLSNAGLQELISNDDIVEGNQNAQIAEYRIPADGTYYVLATRFEGAAGTSTGRYRLELLSIGNAFDSIVEGAGRIVYGTTYAARIDSETPEVLVAFYGVQGDVITASVNRSDGALIPTLELLSENQTVLTRSDPGTEESVRIERVTLSRTGLYYLRVKSADDTRGGFILSLARRFD